MNKRMMIMLGGCVVLFGGIFGYKAFVGHMMTQYFNNMPQQAITVNAREAVKDNWALSLDAVGSVHAINGVEVTTQMAGSVDNIHFNSGDRVKRGETLVSLDSRTDRAQLQSMEAAARLAQQEYERNKKLYERGSISESNLERVVSERDQAVANAEAQRELVKQKTIRAPFAGELGLRQINLGQYLTPGSPIVTLQQLDPIYINFSLPEQNLNEIAQGLKARATMGAWPGEQFEGEITAMEPGVDSQTRNFNIQATFDNKDLKLRPGMFAQVSIQLPESEDVVVVPRTAIKFSPYGNSVFIISEKKVEGEEGEEKTQLIVTNRFVKTGRERGDLVAVTEGLEPGERVATSGLLKLRNDAVVTIDEDNEPGADPTPQPENS
ncbi:MAG: efflux RND transporter periplasmic adaptor subunit [Pseudomonadota bacterium]